MFPSSPPVERTSPEQSVGQSVARATRYIVLLVGLGLLLGGAYHAWGVASFCISAAQEPEILEAPIKGMEKILSLEEANLKAEGVQIPIGRIVAGFFLIVWYAISAWIALLIMSAGGKLALGVIRDRREFLGAMKEFLETLNHEGETGAKAGK